MLNYIDQLDKNDYERIKKYKDFYEIKPWKKTGDYILVLPPSDHVKKWYNIPNWEIEIFEKLKQYTKRKIIVKNKKDNRLKIAKEKFNINLEFMLYFYFHF